MQQYEGYVKPKITQELWDILLQGKKEWYRYEPEMPQVDPQKEKEFALNLKDSTQHQDAVLNRYKHLLTVAQTLNSNDELRAADILLQLGLLEKRLPSELLEERDALEQVRLERNARILARHYEEADKKALQEMQDEYEIGEETGETE